jgi:23S rRNA pseudouridine1911/1915/1917 synthase
LALVWGDVVDEKGTIAGHLGRDPKNRLLMTVFPDGDQGKPAITHYEVVERFG